MGGTQQPFLYDAVRQDARSPTKEFDPKRVTRASYVPKPERPKSDGPLLSFNQHPDAHMVIGPRFSNFKPMSSRTKKWIVAMRNVQLPLRILALNGALGILILMILVSNVDQLAGWVLRITPGVVILHCTYAIYHLSRAAGRRTPGSSAAYHVFAGISDLCVLPIYAYGVLTIRDRGDAWTTILSNQNVMTVFIPALYYTFIGAGGVHLLSLTISLWLGVMFRRISVMPPDLNPLEDRFTSRAKHKRNKSSVATATTMDSEKRLSVPLEERRRSGAPYETLSRPPSIPFFHTRQGSETSLPPSRDSRRELPSRLSGPPPRASPRSSASTLDLNRFSAALGHPYRGSYSEIPLQDSDSSRPSSATLAGTASPAGSKTGKFTEAWYASESLISRTQQRNRAMMKGVNGGAAAYFNNNSSSNSSNTNNTTHTNQPNTRKTYEALSQRYDFPVSDESDSDGEPGDENQISQYGDDENVQTSLRPPTGHPLRSNPTPAPRPKTPYRPYRSSALSEISLNDRSVSGGSQHDVADAPQPRATPGGAGAGGSGPAASSTAPGSKKGLFARAFSGGKGGAVASTIGNRLSSIQPENAFYSKPYGELKSATPPVMVGSNRQLSSGTDFDNGRGGGGAAAYGRRNVSGKIAEEGRAGEEARMSRYSVLDE